ncbi:HepT-like ribonuclease domain-containing protein [Acidithiobacillus sp. AMEEHan]|uniref:HepT-like ribonuclease domain-containing protein n=1 Tax=Acidithiobacillus sp. AMEEHan TaxID=2994951 RepID=UPI0027E3C090|nr:HepT-like ribonuclease domain-containing protein [Acidithiobacillus sp. AMEEHan]
MPQSSAKAYRSVRLPVKPHPWQPAAVYRNIAVHSYQELQLAITVSILVRHLDEFLQYSQVVLLHDAAQPVQ